MTRTDNKKGPQAEGAGGNGAADTIRILCPMPPSANKLYRSVNNRPRKSAEYKAYLRGFATYVVHHQHDLHLIPEEFFDPTAPYELTLYYNFKRIRRKVPTKNTSFLVMDVDNRLKPIVDAIKKFLDIDDANYLDYHLKKRSNGGAEYVHATIRKMREEEIDEGEPI